ncbi:unnamed protein product [Calypogeia fissa]
MEEHDDGLGDVLVECDSNGCIIVMPESRSLADEENGGRYLRCDLSGCYFTPEAPAVKSFEVTEGEGWRLGYETAPESEGSFCAIVLGIKPLVSVSVTFISPLLSSSLESGVAEFSWFGICTSQRFSKNQRPSCLFRSMDRTTDRPTSETSLGNRNGFQVQDGDVNFLFLLLRRMMSTGFVAVPFIDLKKIQKIGHQFSSSAATCVIQA